MLKKYFILTLLTLLYLQGFSQKDAWDNKVLTGTIYNSTETARDSISFTSGFTTKTTKKNINAYTDPNIPEGGYTNGNFNQNYIVSYSPLKDFKINNADNLSIENSKITYQYFDGLGRPIQTVSAKAAPNGKDIIQVYEYDDFGHQANSYLPYAYLQLDSCGAYRDNGIAEQQEFYQDYYETNRAFGFSDFEHNPLARPEKTYGPGENWYNNQKAVEYKYGVNNTVITTILR